MKYLSEEEFVRKQYGNTEEDYRRGHEDLTRKIIIHRDEEARRAIFRENLGKLAGKVLNA